MSVTVEHHVIPSESLHGVLIFDVYVPPCIDKRTAGGYPVIYMLHGQEVGIGIWREMKIDRIIQKTINEDGLTPFLTVVPQEDQFLLSPSLSGFKDAFLNELIPWIDGHYNTCTDRTCRGIGGFSRGALWAERISFENPGLFGSVALLSTPGTIMDDQGLYFLAEKHKPDNLLRIRMDAGSEDNYRHDGNKAAQQLTYIGYPYEYNLQQGAHDMEYWQTQLRDYFLWFSKGWDADQSSLTRTQTAE